MTKSIFRATVSVWSRLALTVLTAVLLAVPIHRQTQFCVGVIALVPWLLALTRARMAEALASGVLLGIVHGIAIAWWIPGALQALGSSAMTSVTGLMIVCAWVCPPVFVGLALAAKLTAHRSTWLRAFAMGAVVIAIERVLATAWWGVPWSLFGYSQLAALGVAQLAVVGGVPLISALLVALAVALADAAEQRPGAAATASALLAAWLTLLVAGLPVAEAMRPRPGEGESAKLLFVQPNLPRGERWASGLQALNLHRVRTYMSEVGVKSAELDALVLPENLLTTPIDASPELAAALRAWVDVLGIPVLSGLVLSAEPASLHLYRSSVVWLEPHRGITARFDKERAIPLFESGRRFDSGGLAALVVGGAAQGRKVQEVEPLGPLRGPIPVTPVLCYEVLFPDLVARRRTAESVAIVNLADDSWVENHAASRHLMTIARFRAIEQRLPLVRLAHGGLSGVVDEMGRLTQTLPLDTYASMELALRPLAPTTVSERAAILALPLAAFAAVWCVCRARGWMTKRGRAS